MNFGEKLYTLRKGKGLSQEALADMLNVSRQAVSRWESDLSYPETEKIIALSEIYGVTVDSLLKNGELSSDDRNTVSEPYWMYRGMYYHYKSKKTLFGLPLVHVSIGMRAKRAKGIIAIGNVATGAIAIGFISCGIFSLGLLSLGLIGLGVLSLGLLFALGSVSIGTFSIGAISLGIFTFGAVSIGMYSIGALAIASKIAVGHHAYGHIAVGKEVAEGIRTFVGSSPSGNSFAGIHREDVRRAIMEEFPNIKNWLVNLMTASLR